MVVQSFVSKGWSPRSHPEEKSYQWQTFLINLDMDPTPKKNLVNDYSSLSWSRYGSHPAEKSGQWLPFLIDPDMDPTPKKI